MTDEYLYLEGHSGISGDMVVAALLDMGASRSKLDEALQSLPLDEFHYHVGRGHSYSMAGCDFKVHLHRQELPQEEPYHAPHHEHGHGHDSHHGHGHHPEHGGERHHEHRHLAEVEAIISKATLTPRALELARRIFRIVAEAEAKAHGCAVDEVHFHEVGAVDSIVDIVAAAVLYDDLSPAGCIVTGLTEGQGTVMCQHGELPVPVPAVMNIAQEHHIPLRPSGTRGEMVTPTGIAIAAALRTADHLPAAYRLTRCGIGLGKRDFGRANFLRACMIQEVASPGQIWQLESNIDDSTPEELGYAMEKIFAAGARDVWFSPCFMKKNRPACLLGALVAEAELQAVEEAILRHTSTIGIRRFPVERTCMERRMLSVHLPEGEALVKLVRHGDIIRCEPEYESIRSLAESTGADFHSLYLRARQAALSLS